MVRAQIHRYISRPKYTRQSPDCPPVIFSFTALPSCFHCSTSYSSAFAQHCIVARPPLPTSCTHVHPHRLHPSRVSPSAPVSLLQVRPLPQISSESQHCGVPSGTLNGARVVESSRMEAKRSVRKEKTHFTIFGGNPFFSRMSRVLLASI